MAGQLITPDLNFVKDIIASGGESLKKCFQCATCSVVCNLAPDDKPFPRKEMIHAQWGLKDRLVRNPDVWLCHHCSDCTAYCPRGAKPGEVLGAVRKLAIEHYSFPRFLGRAVGRPQFLVLLFAIPVIVFLGILAHLGHLNLSAIPRGEDGGIVYSEFVHVEYIDITFIAVSAFAVFSLVIGIYRYWKDLGLDGRRPQVLLAGSILGTLFSTIGEILAHKRFSQCVTTKARQVSHLLVFYSFIGLAITTAWAVLYLYGPGVMESLGMKPFSWMLGEGPYPITDPLKWLANASALALLLGITLTVINRNNNKEKAGLGGYFDWLLITVIYVIVVSGILSEVLRWADIAVVAYPVYFIHLVFVFFLFFYAPFSKMAHMVYRTVAMIFAKHAEKGLEAISKAG